MRWIAGESWKFSCYRRCSPPQWLSNSILVFVFVLFLFPIFVFVVFPVFVLFIFFFDFFFLLLVFLVLLVVDLFPLLLFVVLVVFVVFFVLEVVFVLILEIVVVVIIIIKVVIVGIVLVTPSDSIAAATGSLAGSALEEVFRREEFGQLTPREHFGSRQARLVPSTLSNRHGINLQGNSDRRPCLPAGIST